MRRPTVLHDPLDDLHQVPIVAKDDVGLLQPPVPFDIDLVEPIHEDVRNRAVAKQTLERPQAEELVEDVDHQRFTFLQAEGRRVLAALDDVEDQPTNLRFGLLLTHLRQAVEVEPVQQLGVDASLQILVAALPGIRGGDHSPTARDSSNALLHLRLLLLQALLTFADR